MASIANKIFLQTQTPLLLARRFRGKINIQRPRKPHYDRALVEVLTKPTYAYPPLTMETCQKPQKDQAKVTENPYIQLIARGILNWFNHSKCTAIFHLNSINAEDVFKAKVLFHRQNMHLKAYPKKAITMALSGSKFEEILPVFETRCALVFSPDGNPNKLIKLAKKVPQIILLGAIAEERILNRNQFVEYAALPGIDFVRAQLVGILNSAAGDLVGKMEGHQSNIVRMLEAHAKSEESGK